MFYQQWIKRQHFLCGRGLESILETHPNEALFIRLPLKISLLLVQPCWMDKRYYELLQEKGFLFLLSNFSCLYPCFILTFHSFLPLFPFSTVTAFCFGNKQGVKGKTKHPAMVADGDKSVGRFFRNLRKETPWFLSPQVSAALRTMAFLPTSRGQDETRALFFLSLPSFKLEQTIFT